MKFRGFARLQAGFAATLAALFLASCVVVEDGPRPGPPPLPDRPQACTFEYAPVCGQRGRDQQTFGNACMARADGYRIVAQGECRAPGRPGRPGSGGPQMCTQQYDPVCAERRGNRQTFGNECIANAEGFRIVHGGECRGDGGMRPGPGGGRPPQACTREYAPVCARRGNEVRTFGNQCEADSAGYRTVSRGTC